MKINKTVIKKLDPCADRFENFKKHYSDFDGEVHEFLNLENITYNDKVWVMTRLMTKNQLVHWAIMCAESVKIYFNVEHPKDKRLDDLFDLLNSIEDFTKLTEKQKNKINTAAYAASNSTAYAYASYAAYAAVSDSTAYAASYASYASYAASEEQRNLNLLFLASNLE